MSATEDLADSSCALRDDARELIYGVQPLLTLAIVHGREAEKSAPIQPYGYRWRLTTTAALHKADEPRVALQATLQTARLAASGVQRSSISGSSTKGHCLSRLLVRITGAACPWLPHSVHCHINCFSAQRLLYDPALDTRVAGTTEKLGTCLPRTN
jgi:hypothetical protein